MKQPILLLHGALGSASQLTDLKNYLENKGADVHTLNFSSHGGSAPSHDGFGIDVFSKEVFVFINKHSFSQVQIFGYSMGGYVALWLAHTYPEKISRIVTLGTKFDWNKEVAEFEVLKLIPEKILEKVPDFAKVLEHRHGTKNWKYLMQKTANMMIELGNSPLLTTPNLSSINSETLICLGEFDKMADRAYSEEVANLLPNGTFKLLSSTPHELERVDKSLLYSTISSFLLEGRS